MVEAQYFPIHCRELSVVALNKFNHESVSELFVHRP